MRYRRFLDGNESLEIDIAPVNALCIGGLMRRFITSQGCNVDGVQVKLRHRLQDGSATIKLGSGCVFHLGPGLHWGLGDAQIEDAVRGNRLHEDLVIIRQHHCLAHGSEPRHIVWAPGLYGPDIERKAPGFLLRPMALSELRQGTLLLHELSRISALNTKESATGLWCLDGKNEEEVRVRGRLLLRNSSPIRFIDRAGQIYRMRRELDDRVSALLQFA